MKKKSERYWGPAKLIAVLTLFHLLFTLIAGGLVSIVMLFFVVTNSNNIPQFLKEFLLSTAPGENFEFYYAGLLSSLIFIPLALGIEYYTVREWSRGGKVRWAVDRAVRDYPIFASIYSSFIFFQMVATGFVPFYLFLIYWRAREKLDLKTVIVPLVMFFLLPFSELIRTSFLIRRTLVVLFLIATPLMVYLAASD